MNTNQYIESDNQPLRDLSRETPTPLYSREYAMYADDIHEKLRSKYGAFAPVELAPPMDGFPGVRAMMVLGHSEAIHVLNNPDMFSKDPRNWRALRENLVPPNSPVLPMMGYRPNALFSDGAEHKRFRDAVTQSMNKIDRYKLQKYSEDSANLLIDQFIGTDRLNHVDLLHSYAKMLPLLVFTKLFGCPEHLGERLVASITGIFDSGENADQWNIELHNCLNELVSYKRGSDDEDVTAYLIKHESRLSDSEMVNQLVMLMSAGTEPQRNLIANGLKNILSDGSYSTNLFGDNPTIQDALMKVMWDEPPMTNYAVHFPQYDVVIGDVLLRRGDPIIIGFRAANHDPVVRASGNVYDSSAHLGYSSGPHTCPAKEPSWMIAHTAIERILIRIPDLALEVPKEQLANRPGPFTLGLTALPARFNPDAGGVASLYPTLDRTAMHRQEAPKEQIAPPSSIPQQSPDPKPVKKSFRQRLFGKSYRD